MLAVQPWFEVPTHLSEHPSPAGFPYLMLPMKAEDNSVINVLNQMKEEPDTTEEWGPHCMQSPVLNVDKESSSFLFWRYLWSVFYKKVTLLGLSSHGGNKM